MKLHSSSGARSSDRFAMWRRRDVGLVGRAPLSPVRYARFGGSVGLPTGDTGMERREARMTQPRGQQGRHQDA